MKRRAPQRAWVGGRAARCSIALAAFALTSCISLTTDPRAVIMDGDGNIQVRSVPCAVVAAAPKPTTPTAGGLNPDAIRVLTWNIHKQEDEGWADDLAQFARATDVVMLQEVTLSPPLRSALDDAGLRWAMASSFLYGDIDIGVMTATRIAPVATCTERAMEPLLRIPKSAVVSWFALEGRDQTLAVVNLHAINFSITLGAYRAQLLALRDALVSHEGPIVFAGDMNTWNEARLDAVRETAKGLRMTEITIPEDKRSVFYGRQLDHLLVRGLDVVAASAVPVKSSDHNPVLATLRVHADQ